MKAKDVMTTNVKSCRPDANAAEAVKIMWDQAGAASPRQVVDALAGICEHRVKPALAGAA